MNVVTVELYPKYRPSRSMKYQQFQRTHMKNEAI